MRKEKYVKKFRKVHIWPSVLFMILTLMLAIGASASFIEFTLRLFTEERINTEIVRADAVFSRFIDNDGNKSELLSKMIDENEITDSFFIYDKNGKILAGYGNETYDLDNNIFENSANIKYNVYCDNGIDNIITSKGNLKLLLAKLITIEDSRSLTEYDYDEKLCEAKIWVECHLSENERAIMRCTTPICANDYIEAIFAGCTIFFLFMIPLFLFFINLILSFSNQKRMTDVLYTNFTTGSKNFLYFLHTAENLNRSRRISYFVADITVMKYRSYCNYHGVHAGEALLEDIDTYLNTVIRKREIVALADKSSFVLLLRYKNREDAEQHMNDMVCKLKVKYANEAISFHSGIFFLEDIDKSENKNIDFADCFSRAGAAKASLTDDSISGVAVYNESTLEQQLWEHKVGEKMENALKNNEFHVYIQPKYDPVSEKLSGAEALIRWINEEDGFIPPGKFIPIFEKNGFITNIDDFMIASVAKLQSEWLSKGKEIVPISVNVSRAHFADPNLADHICEIVDKYKVPHKFIEIELTESAFFDDKGLLIQTVKELHEMGFEISMDDFGAGYSSLNSLKDLPLDVLKLDADFFRGENTEGRGEIVVAQAIALAKKLDMRIVAEGIEHREQVDFLAGQGCDMIQGYYFAKPMPASEYAERLSGSSEEEN